MATLPLMDILISQVMSDVELSYLETLSVSRKFKLVLLYKDHKQKIIEGFDSAQLPNMKELLKANKIQYAEGRPLDWGQIMKEVREDPQQFTEAGGWDGLDLGIIKPLSCSSCERKISRQLISKEVGAVLEKEEGGGDPGCDSQDGPPSKKTRLEEIPDQTQTNLRYHIESDEESIISLDKDELTSLNVETPKIRRKILEKTNTNKKKFSIDEYAEKISKFCHASRDNQNKIKLSHNQLLRLGERFSTKFRRSPVFALLPGTTTTTTIRKEGSEPVVAWQKIQIVKKADGQWQLKGLLPMSEQELVPLQSRSKTSTFPKNNKIVGIPGNNTHTIKGGILKVLNFKAGLRLQRKIAEKLKSGEAKLANLDGKRVLIMSRQKEAPSHPQPAHPTRAEVSVQAPLAPVPPIGKLSFRKRRRN